MRKDLQEAVVESVRQYDQRCNRMPGVINRLRAVIATSKAGSKGNDSNTELLSVCNLVEKEQSCEAARPY